MCKLLWRSDHFSGSYDVMNLSSYIKECTVFYRCKCKKFSSYKDQHLNKIKNEINIISTKKIHRLQFDFTGPFL